MNSIQRLDVAPRWSGASVHNGTLYLSGLVAEDRTQGLEGQTRQVFDKLDELLRRYGSDKSRILMCEIYLADIRHIDAMNAVWDSWICRDSPCCRATVEARLARTDMLIELVVTAAA